MSVAREIRELPLELFTCELLELAAYYESKDSMSMADKVSVSDKAWLIEDGAVPLAVAGVYKGTFLGTQPTLWLALTKRFKPLYVRGMRLHVNQLRKMYPQVFAWVEAGVVPAHRFAVVCGLHTTHRTKIKDDVTYIQYEVV